MLHLTKREKLIIGLTMHQGLSSADAGEKVGISKRTVDFHLQNIYRKLEVSTRIQAYNKVAAGLVEL
jgi:ATP/maltotriose-dependent transcriptional regulator MalT